MDDAVAQLGAVIAAHVREWESAHVELEVYGTDDGGAIAREVDAFCRRELGGAVVRPLFHVSSIGCVTAVELVDGRRVVVKAHPAARTLARLQEIVRVQMHLASRGLPATTVCGGPAPIGRGLALVEAFVDRGVARDAHEPAVRAALASTLHALVAACRPLVATSTLKPHLVLPPDALWPTPHSKLFDFVATSEGAGWIDDVARAARARMRDDVGELVIGHGDWRAEHARFAEASAHERGERIVAAFDWDSLMTEREPRLVGFTTHAFCANWERIPPSGCAPTIDEARAFVADYERARGRSFGSDERSVIGAAFAYSCAYTARCGWALGHDERGVPGTFQALVAAQGTALLAL